MNCLIQSSAQLPSVEHACKAGLKICAADIVKYWSAAITHTSSFLLLGILVFLAGCAAGPGTLVASDVADLKALSEPNVGRSDEELREIEGRPLPQSIGIGYDVALVRRALASSLRGNLTGLRETRTLAVQKGSNEDIVLSVRQLAASAERTAGNIRAASEEYALIERKFIEISRRTGKKIYTNPTARTFLNDYLFVAMQAADTVLANRLITSYLQPALTDPTVADEDRFLIQMYIDDYRFSAQSLQGDPSGAYAGRLAALRAYQDQRRRLKKVTPALDSVFTRKALDFNAKAGSDAIAFARPSLALEQLRILKRASQDDRTKMQFHIDELEGSILGFTQDYERALEHQSQMWARLPELARKVEQVRTGFAVSRANYLIALGRWQEAESALTGVQGKPEILAALDLYIGLRSVIRAVLTKPDPQLGEFVALQPRYLQRSRGTDASIYYFAATAIIFQQRAIVSGSSADLVSAVQGGRELSRNLRLLQASGFAGQTTLAAPLLRMAKESYVIATSATLGRNGVSMDDLLDALQLLQSSEIDRDISATSARLRSIPGVSPQQLRELQELQRTVQSAQSRLAALSRTADAEQATIDSIAAEADKASQRLDRLMSELRRSSPQMQHAFGGTDSISLRDMQARLAAGEGVVALAPLSESTLVVVITNTRIEHRLVSTGANRVSALVDRVRRSTAFDSDVRVPDFDTAAARELYALLLGWSNSPLRGIRSLTVAATGPLGAVPFGLLVQDQARPMGDKEYTRLPWLIRAMSITHAPSLSGWFAMTGAQAAQATGGFIAWADPDFTGRTAAANSGTRGVRAAPRSAGQSAAARGGALPANLGDMLPPLPETKAEAEAIARTLGGSAQRDVVAGSAATRASVLERSASGDLARRSVVMFATHGLAPSQVPGLNQPALAMARGDSGPESSLLQLEDVVGLRLNADWVILSACNTASADRLGGDALSGLARGFFFAGARGMLVTHWEVESESAAAITTKTIERYVGNPRLSRAQALQQTSLELIDAKRTPADWSHPAFWAPYALVGDGRRSGAAR